MATNDDELRINDDPSHSLARGGDDISPSVNILSKLDVLTESVNRLVGVMVPDPATSFVDEESLLDDDPCEFDPSLSLSGDGDLQTSRNEGLASTELLPDEDLFNAAEERGTDISADLGKRVDTACTKKPAKDKFVKIQQLYLRPRNCSLHLVPKVNPELWDDLSDSVRGQQLGLPNLQPLFVKSFNPLLSLANNVVQARSNKAETIPIADLHAPAVDTVTLLGNAVHEFSMKRREFLKPEVADGFKSLCRENQSVTTWLFGDELPQSIQNIAQLKRMSLKRLSQKRRSEGSNGSSKKFCRSSPSFQSNSLNFKHRSDPRRPWRNLPWEWHQRHDTQRNSHFRGQSNP